MPIFGQTNLIPGLKKTSKLKSDIFPYIGVPSGCMKNVEFEFGAFVKCEIKLIIFRPFFKFVILLHKNTNLE